MEYINYTLKSSISLSRRRKANSNLCCRAHSQFRAIDFLGSFPNQSLLNAVKTAKTFTYSVCSLKAEIMLCPC